jgi:hypothetical protein
MVTKHVLGSALAATVAFCVVGSGIAHAQAMSSVCTFTTGPRAGTSYDYALIGWQPLAVGTPCLDGAGSTGYVGGVATRAMHSSTVCHFTAGPRAGTSFDYRATWAPLPAGTPCLDGAGSTGIVR